MGRNRQPVGAWAGDIALFERPHDLGKNPLALLDEDQNILGPHRPPPRPDRRPPFDPAGNRIGNPVRQLFWRRRKAFHRLGRPGLRDLRAVGIFDHRPDFDPPALPRSRRLMPDGFGQKRCCDIGPAKHLVHTDKDFPQRAKTCFQRLSVPDAPRRPGCRRQRASLVQKQFWLGPLKRIDRLLGVAHRKDRLGPLRCPRSGKIIVDQRIDHRPLLGIGVLALIDKDMVDPRIELVAHPFAHAPVAQQRRRARHQIVEIHKRAGPLLRLVAFQDCRENPCERRAVFGDGQGLGFFKQPFEPFRLGRQPLGQFGHGRDNGFGREPALGRRPCCGEIGGEKLAGGWGRPVDPPQLVLEPGPLGDAGRCQRPDHGKFARRNQHPIHNLAVERFDCLARAQPHAGPHRPNRPLGIGKDRTQLAVVGKALANRGFDLAVAERIEQCPHRIAHRPIGLEPFGDHPLARLAQQRRGVRVLDDREIDRHAGLARKALQHRLAKGVDGVDLEPARRIERMGEKAPCPKLFGLRRAVIQKLEQIFFQPGLAGPRPSRQNPRHPVPHFGRRRLGIGQAQDCLGLRPVQQQPQYPAREHIGLARPRIGRNPGIGPRLGHPRLLGIGIGRDAKDFLAHSPSSPPSSSVHSSVRARWS